LKETDKVLEIGAGTGFLTRELCKHCKVFAVEIDEVLCELLGKELTHVNVEILCGDFLKIELPDFNKVVSIPPYHISKKIMFKLLRHGFELAVLVFQDEFAEKLVAQPGFPQYSALSVLCQYKTEPNIIGTIGPGSFFPKPKAKSAIIRLVSAQRECKVLNEELFFRFVVELFRYRKKNVENALLCSRNFIESGFGLKHREATKALAGFDLTKKVDLTEVGEFIEMFNALCAFSGSVQ
ncbi:MAG: ribosomal RNA small subunit methyltransferase A, partial [Candidatus Diapherotrites archaeon]|nr:ribosomal RNA small subunit methyltransferase A [Candidatus Diapherotrites archaeon]